MPHSVLLLFNNMTRILFTVNLLLHTCHCYYYRSLILQRLIVSEILSRVMIEHPIYIYTLCKSHFGYFTPVHLIIWEALVARRFLTSRGTFRFIIHACIYYIDMYNLQSLIHKAMEHIGQMQPL